MRKNLLINYKFSNIFLFFTFFFVCVISVGYSALATNLLVSGEAYIRVPAEIRVTNVLWDTSFSNGYETYDGSEYYKNGIKLFTTLPNLDSSVTYDVEITNSSSIPYVIKEINTIFNSNENIKYGEISGVEIDEIINGNTILHIKVPIMYDDSLDVLPNNNNSTIEIQFVFEIADMLPPTMNVEIVDNLVTLTAADVGASGLSEDNLYKYYLSTSEEELTGGTWLNYTNGEQFSVDAYGHFYLWVYPVKDKAGNVNDEKTFGNPYVIGEVYNYAKLYVDLDGGSTSVELPIEMLPNNEYTLANLNLSKNGYYISDWSIVSGEGSQINEGIFTMGNSDTTIKPIWQATEYTITYELNSGTVATANPTKYTVETETFTLNNPTRDGYTFNGWTGSNGSTASTSVSIAKGSTGDKTYTANWTANTYTITYDCNGGSGSTAMSTHTYGVAKALTSNGCYKITAGTSGAVYQFMGWSTSSSATSATYTNGQSVTNLAKTGNVDLYAVWKSIFTYSGTKNVIHEGSGNWRVDFKGNGTLTINVASTYQFFAVGGGGSGGANRTGTDYRYNGAGGGGGGYTTVKSETFSTAGSTYTVTIGAGGAAVTACCSSTATPGKDGGTTKMVSNSSGSTIISAAGGKGGASSAYGGGAGGAGTGAGGKGGSQTTSVGTAGTGPKGKNGAAAFTTTSVTTTTSGVTYYGAGGGGGGAYYNSTSYAGAAGGTTGGGHGGGYAHLDATHSTITAGTANTGAGGGGTGGGANNLTSKAGGSGILMMRNPR